MLFIVSDVDAPVGLRVTAPTSVRRRGREGAGREVRPLLALRAGVRTEPDWAGICDRCVDALAEPVNSLMAVPSGLQLELWIAGVIVVARSGDQGARAVRASSCTRASTVIPGFFDLTRVHNYGAAFGLMNAADFPFKTAVLSIVAAVALAALALVRRHAAGRPAAARGSAWRSSSAARRAT